MIPIVRCVLIFVKIYFLTLFLSLIFDIPKYREKYMDL